MLFQFILPITFLFYSCHEGNTSQSKNETLHEIASKNIINPNGKTIQERIHTPEKFIRMEVPPHSFGSFLRNFPLKEHGNQVKLFNGHLKNNQTAHIAILDISVGNLDLQQCADAVMRLRAEYLFSEHKYDSIHFNFTNGFNAQYSKWRQGFGIKVKGNECSWSTNPDANSSAKSFSIYLQKVFTFAGSLSLSKELKFVSSIDRIESGDVFIRGGSPGHAVIVMDVAKNNNTGEKIFLIAQSYMPAQEIHILKNPKNEPLSPWYSANEIEEYLYTPEYTFSRNELMRF